MSACPAPRVQQAFGAGVRPVDAASLHLEQQQQAHSFDQLAVKLQPDLLLLLLSRESSPIESSTSPSGFRVKTDLRSSCCHSLLGCLSVKAISAFVPLALLFLRTSSVVAPPALLLPVFLPWGHSSNGSVVAPTALLLPVFNCFHSPLRLPLFGGCFSVTDLEGFIPGYDPPPVAYDASCSGRRSRRYGCSTLRNRRSSERRCSSSCRRNGREIRGYR